MYTCSWHLLNHDAPLMLGGPGSVVENDEPLFRHKLVSCLGVMRIVPDMSARTLLPIMQQHLRSGTTVTVHSDKWTAYSRVQQLTAVSTHGVVNHSLPLCGPGHWCVHPECGVLLESCEDEVQEDEGCA